MIVVRRFSLALVAALLLGGAALAQGGEASGVVAACGEVPAASEGEAVAAYNACVLTFAAERLDQLTPGAEFVEALPVLALLVVAGIGWRVGTGF